MAQTYLLSFNNGSDLPMGWLRPTYYDFNNGSDLPMGWLRPTYYDFNNGSDLPMKTLKMAQTYLLLYFYYKLNCVSSC